ncbi:DUF3422 family protein [Trinickia dinghuensis]|uniref:DUF3422 family protein n=1 Tax=Trinickia dinghuensis TaxID=2291023 RepID=A0A3D8K4V4_9BURK|nr:DUF3422 domain-containing protein [Trinickia dinghuensis]RDV00241.1 DUF3422 family protein [Trinickia dinghuensis]
MFSSLNHPLREPLSKELHARPFLRIDGPATLSHLAIYSERDEEIHARLLATLTAAMGLPAPAPQHNHYTAQKGDWQIKWEKHTEFSTFTFVDTGAAGPQEELFRGAAMRDLPDSWLAQLKESVLVAVHAELRCGGDAEQTRKQVQALLPGPVLVGTKVLAGGEVYCDWLVHEDHFSRFLVLDLGFREAQAGRLIQRLFEIETYRMMALLALPDARRHSGFLGKLDASLSVFMRRMEQPGEDHDDAYLLRELTRLAGQIEASAGLETRFSASAAYEKLVLARIAELREERIEGFPTIAEFMQRRLLPAMQTCGSVWTRHQQSATRVARAVDLLRTRVNLAQEEHTTALLEGMNRTARTQLRMQHAVEGLSVAAISYYVLNLSGAALRALHAAHLSLDPDIFEGFLIIPVVAAVVLFTGRIRRLGHDEPQRAEHK